MSRRTRAAAARDLVGRRGRPLPAPEFKAQLLDVIEQGSKGGSSTQRHDVHRLDHPGRPRRGVKRLRTSDGELSLVCSDRNIAKIFEITGLDRVFAIYPTRRGSSRSPPRAPPPRLTRRRRTGSGDAGVFALLAGAGAGGRVASPARTPTTPTGSSCSRGMPARATPWPTREPRERSARTWTTRFAGGPRAEALQDSRRFPQSVVHGQILFPDLESRRRDRGTTGRNSGRAGNARKPRHRL